MSLFPRELRDLSWTPRWSIARVQRRETVAEHHFYVVVYSDILARLIGWPATDWWNSDDFRNYRDLLRYASQHDWAESFMSDIPGPVKRNIKDQDKYQQYEERGVHERFLGTGVLNFSPSADVKAIVKCADLVDEVLYLAGEKQQGNRAIEGFYRSALERLELAFYNLPWNLSISTDERRTVWRDMIEPAINEELTGSSIAPHNNSDVAK